MTKYPQSSTDGEALETLETLDFPGVAPAAAIGLLPALAVELAAIEPPAAVASALRQRLRERAARSAAASQLMRTQRLGDRVWRELWPGVRICTQHRDDTGQASLIELEAGASWRLGHTEPDAQPSPGVHECLVLAGEVELDAAALGAATLRAHDYQLIGLDASSQGPARISSAGGALLYGYSSWAGVGEFGETRASHRLSSDADAAVWQPLRQGVAIKPLHVVGERIAMLVRFEPGARVPAHPHGMGEACLMLAGDLFLGDVLLREGEFQFAPAGTAHGELFSDVGCLLYFSGAIDPAAMEPAAMDPAVADPAPPVSGARPSS